MMAQCNIFKEKNCWQFVVMWPKLWAWWGQLIQWRECAKGGTEGREPRPCILMLDLLKERKHNTMNIGNI